MRTARPLLYLIVGLSGAALVLWLTWVTASILQQTEDNGRAVRHASEAADTILDCSVPGGECYKRSEERTAQAVSGVNEGTLRIITAALVCDDRGVTKHKALLRCTVKLAGNDEGRVGAP